MNKMNGEPICVTFKQNGTEVKITLTRDEAANLAEQLTDAVRDADLVDMCRMFDHAAEMAKLARKVSEYALGC